MPIRDSLYYSALPKSGHGVLFRTKLRSPPSSSSLSCASGGARALPSSLGMRLLPAAHPLNTDGVDLIVAPLESCTAMLSATICATKQVVAMDGVTRYVIGTAAMEAGIESARIFQSKKYSTILGCCLFPLFQRSYNN